MIESFEAFIADMRRLIFEHGDKKHGDSYRRRDAVYYGQKCDSHLEKWKAGNRLEADSGHSHWTHIAANAFFANECERQPK